MARGTLHAPKGEGRRRRNAPTHGEQVVSDDGEIRGEALSSTYSDAVIEWHETWRRSPQAALFEATDWQRLRILAPIMEAYFRRPSAAALSEIRMNEERLGATVTDRMRARIRIDRDDDVEGGLALAPVVDARAAIAARLQSGA